jgi:hypothetical protein
VCVGVGGCGCVGVWVGVGVGEIHSSLVQSDIRLPAT